MGTYSELLYSTAMPGQLPLFGADSPAPNGTAMPVQAETRTDPAAGEVLPSKVEGVSSSLGALRLTLGRLASDRAPVLSSLRSSVGLGPRLPLLGEEERTEDDGTAVVKY